MQGANRKCPSCRQPVDPESTMCSLCGAILHIKCEYCGHLAFIEGNCSHCKSSQYVICSNPACGKLQLISPDGKCRNCGKSIHYL